MKKLWLVGREEDGNDYVHDVIGAETALEAARVYVATIKADNVEEIEYGKRQYAKLVAEGRMKDPYEHSGFQISYELPKAVYAVPVRVEGKHAKNIHTDRSDQSDAFEGLWDWGQKQIIRL